MSDSPFPPGPPEFRHGPVPPGYPQQQPPQGGFPPPSGGPGFPGGPQGPFPPGGPPPRPGPPPLRSRKGLAIGAGIGAGVLVAGLLGFAVRENLGGRPYTELPSCRDLLPAQVVDTIPGADRPRAEGEYTEMTAEQLESYGGSGGLKERGYIGALYCQVFDDGDVLLDVAVHLYDYGRYTEYLEGEREAYEEAMRKWEEEESEGSTMSRSGAGDFARTFVSEGDGGERYGFSVFSDSNVEVSIGRFAVPRELGDEEALDFLNGFAEEVARRLSRTAERE